MISLCSFQPQFSGLFTVSRYYSRQFPQVVDDAKEYLVNSGLYGPDAHLNTATRVFSIQVPDVADTFVRLKLQQTGMKAHNYRQNTTIEEQIFKMGLLSRLRLLVDGK